MMELEETPEGKSASALMMLAAAMKDEVQSESFSVAFPDRAKSLPALNVVVQMWQRGQDFDARAVYGLLPKSGKSFPRVARLTGLAAIGSGDVELFDQVRADIEAFSARAESATDAYARDLLELEFRLRLRIAEDEPAWLSRFDFSRVPRAWFTHAAFLGIGQLMVTRQYASALAACRVLILTNLGQKTDTELDVWLRVASAVCCRRLLQFKDMEWWAGQAAQTAAACQCIQPYLQFMLGRKDPLFTALVSAAPKLAEIVRWKEQASFLNMIRLHNHLTGEQITDLLSRRKMFIVEHIAHGNSYQEIAQMLGVSLGRLRNLSTDAYKILKIHRRGELQGRVW